MKNQYTSIEARRELGLDPINPENTGKEAPHSSIVVVQTPTSFINSFPHSAVYTEVEQEDVWPPAPTTYNEPEAWAWCLQCNRASTMISISDNDGYCTYDNCSATTGDMVAWHDLMIRIPELPEHPEVDVIYADLIHFTEEKSSANPKAS